MYTRSRVYSGLAILTIVILAGSLAYYYNEATAQISSLKSDGRAFCATVDNAIKQLTGVLSNTTVTLQRHIQEDDSIIAGLNSTRPTGYANMTATLQGEITQDTDIINAINSMFYAISPVSSGLSDATGPCAPFN
jgi:hypothetical protein